MAQGDKSSLEPRTGWNGARDRQHGQGVSPLAAALPVEKYLAAIIAHELSNPFTALAGRVDLMRARKDLPATLIRDLEAMRSANERIERILSNLKSFSRREAPPPRPVELLPVVRAAVESFRLSPSGIRVEVTMVPWDGAVRAVADPALLEAAIAATLETLATRSLEIQSIELRLTMNPADEEVSLLFRDQGPEINEEQIARVFHPFSGQTLNAWGGAITLAYGYYIIRAWGGTYRFRSDGRDTITELSLALQL